jgi:hypothetical protein
MIKRIKKAGIFLLLSFAVSFLIYAQKPDDSVSVSNLDFASLLSSDTQEQDSSSADQVWEVCDSTQDAGETLREAFRERKTKITLMLSEEDSQGDDYNNTFEQIYDIALEHTGTGDEGDYLKWNLNEISVTYAKSSSTFEVLVAYLDDADMEAQTSEAVKAVEQSLQIAGEDSAYDKIYSIYDYLANNITYDKQDESNLPHTAYDAIVNGRAVCQGYAMIFYRILLDYGIDNRIIVSDTHAWNLVDLDGEYYECDLTWDSQEAEEGNPYFYFMKADLSEGNTSHDWKKDVLDGEVLTLDRASTDYETDEDESTFSDIERIADHENGTTESVHFDSEQIASRQKGYQGKGYLIVIVHRIKQI